jgi:hypothetical protein
MRNLGPLPKVPKRRTTYKQAEFVLSETLHRLEVEHKLTIAEMVLLLSNSLSRFVQPVVNGEWETRDD